MAGTVKALWVATFEAELPDKTRLIPNETVVDVPEGEVVQSDNWRPVKPKTAKDAD